MSCRSHFGIFRSLSPTNCADRSLPEQKLAEKVFEVVLIALYSEILHSNIFPASSDAPGCRQCLHPLAHKTNFDGPAAVCISNALAMHECTGKIEDAIDNLVFF